MRFDRRRTYEGQGSTQKSEQEAIRVAIGTHIPTKVGGVIKNHGKSILPINVMMRFIGQARQWRFAANRMTSGGTSPFFGYDPRANVAKPIAAIIPVSSGGNRIDVSLDRKASAGVSFKWSVTVNGVTTEADSAIVELNGFSMRVAPIVNFLNTDVVSVSHLVPGEGVSGFKNYPVINDLP